MNPEPRFAWNGDSTVAYEVVGNGPVDLVYMPGFINNPRGRVGQPADRAVPEAPGFLLAGSS
jgi:hypothetical protein